ncbi:MAG: HDOD domain-containing protein [Propionivibrio sp.]|nr:HDOD domain-containing protein [Propionivibrio sp.]
MTNQPQQSLESWIDFFSKAEMPVLRKTLRQLEEARSKIDRINGRDIAAIVLQDPLMSIRVLAYIQPFISKRLHSDITNIGNAIMMQGIEPFFKNIGEPPTIEAMLKNEPQALLGVLQVIRRSQRASRYAHLWAVERYELNIEEVTLAALLHDIAEILIWCFFPKQAVIIRSRLQADKALRSMNVQKEVLGFYLYELKQGLCSVMHLPELIMTLMDQNNAELPRVLNVLLAVNLARHSADGWENAALPDDFTAIQKLLRIDRETLLKRLDIPDDLVARYLVPADED